MRSRQKTGRSQKQTNNPRELEQEGTGFKYTEEQVTPITSSQMGNRKSNWTERWFQNKTGSTKENAFPYEYNIGSLEFPLPSFNLPLIFYSIIFI